MPANGFPSREEVVNGLSALCKESGVPGISVATSHGGVRAYAHAGVADLNESAPLSDQSRFEMSCLMKFFVSLIAQNLTHRQLLDPSAAIGRYIAELSQCSVGQSISVGNLLSHTSGYRGLDVTDARVKWGYSWQKLVEHLRQGELLFPPDQVFSYEHSEHVIAGEILQRITGRTIDQLLYEELMGPLSITIRCSREDQRRNSFVGQHVPAAEPQKFVPSRQPAFSAFWRSSLPDMTISLQDVLTVGEWILVDKNRNLLGALHHQVIDLPPQVTASTQAEQIPLSFGQVCGSYAGGLLGHNGSTHGQTVALRIDPPRRAVYAVGLNAWVPHVRDRAIRLISGKSVNGFRDAANGGGENNMFPISELAGSFSFSDLVGVYDGGFARQVAIESSGSSAISMLVGAPGSRQRRITVSRVSGDKYQFGSNQSVSCVFTAHPIDGSPVLRLGVHAYRKRR